MSEQKFIDGFYAKEPHPKVKEFIKCNIGIKKEVFQAWLSNQDSEYVNIDVKVAKSGKWYAQLNEFKPKEKPDEYRANNTVPDAGFSAQLAPIDDLPF